MFPLKVKWVDKRISYEIKEILDGLERELQKKKKMINLYVICLNLFHNKNDFKMVISNSIRL